jgi:hypothetical protein
LTCFGKSRRRKDNKRVPNKKVDASPKARIQAFEQRHFNVGNEMIMKTMPEDHPLIGTWITDDEDSNVAVMISVKNGSPHVECFIRSDGEFYEISNLSWDGTRLEFEGLIPSSGWRTRHVFSAAPDGTANVEFTWFEVWKKKDVKPGELPKAWREEQDD